MQKWVVLNSFVGVLLGTKATTQHTTKAVQRFREDQQRQKIENADTKKLVEGYAKAINSKDKMFVSVVKRNESVTITNKEVSESFKGYGGVDAKFGRFIDDDNGGGVTQIIDNQTLSVIVMDSKFENTYFDKTTGNNIKQVVTAGETSSHEILGHALGYFLGGVGSTAYRHESAIQMSNIYLRASGINNMFRTGEFHPINNTPGVLLLNNVANGTPPYLQ